LLLQQSTVILEQSRVALLHLLQKCQEVAVALEKALLGDLRKSPSAMGDQGRPVQPEPREREFARGGPCVQAAIGEQQQVALATTVSWVPQDRIGRP
jgi:hypothetical protein